MSRSYKFIIAVLLAAVYYPAAAQKLPSVQKNSLRAPADIKIDGQTTEWKGQFQAYNSATDVFYTMANDDENLYLTIQATKPDIVNKAVTGGITFTIDHGTKKDDKDPMIITFPVLNDKDKSAFNNTITKKITKSDTATMRKQTDSLVLESNKLLTKKLKMIKVLGIKAVADTFISVYNEQNIQIEARFDHKRGITFELAIPLKLLGLSATTPTPFAYNIKLMPAPFGGAVITRSSSGAIMMITITGAGSGGESGRYPTDFWAEYTPAKK